MQQVQEKLEFEIETPSDKELAKRFADRQAELAELLGAGQVEVTKNLRAPNTSRNYKKRQRKNAKKRARQHG